MRFLLLALAVLAASLPSSCFASEPQAVALEAVTKLFVNHDLGAFRSFVADEAVQGDLAPGSAVSKLNKQRSEKLASVELAQIIFFRKADMDELEDSYPDDLWPRVRKHIGDQQGVLVKLALKGDLAERARAAGKDPRDVAMMTFVVSSEERPKIVHVDDN
ncbi:hypothetical protein [Aporhodopirellula aestuarii]|uniref:Uncharacterized protein n=1 Tax=Aporhodopirellula aestuarii TaxID=2950107 RepID=A0ABT0U9D7_9BACT|nr:hypothetical protein [Aporhodopirellula aestuarii]MCM2373588.1 hypothetical protein [Aporhodopirellula aestuarii]